MKLTTKQKKIKFNKDLEEFKKESYVVRTYEDTYQIVIAFNGFIFDYYSSTESWSSRCSGKKVKGSNKESLIVFIKTLDSDSNGKAKERINFINESLDVSKNNNDKLVEKFINLQKKACPQGIIEKLAFWIIGKRGYKVIKQKENKDE